MQSSKENPLTSIPDTIGSFQHPTNVNLIRLISSAFINTMGITQPSPQNANRAAWFIVILLALVVTGVAGLAFFAIHWFSTH
jgi:hypothetical protein